MKKPAAKPKLKTPKVTRGPAAMHSPLEPLGVELYGVVREALTRYGFKPAEQRRLFERSQRTKHIKRASDPLLHQLRVVGDLISAWREEAEYVDATGQPRILQIEGKGATFESLVRRFLPDHSVAQVVAIACRAASVGTLAGGRIALYGDTLVDLSLSKETALAQTICHITRIFETCLHNVRRAEDDAVVGRLERLVNQVMSAEDFERFERAIRPQLHDLCERVDRLLTASAQKSPRKKGELGTAGMGLYVYYDGAMKHVKHGRE